MIHCIELLKNEILEVIGNIVTDNDLEVTVSEKDIILSPPKIKEHGDLSTNFAMAFSKKLKKNPRELASLIVSGLNAKGSRVFSEVSIAGPGFINFKLSTEQLYEGIQRILASKKSWGKHEEKPGKINLEFVSANPTGPMHVGHGRGAAVGDSVARILRFAGYSVTSEYYLNDAGRQVDNLAKSVYARYLEILNKIDSSVETIEFPEDGYHGEYVYSIANDFFNERGAEFSTGYNEDVFKEFAIESALTGIKKTLKDLDITFDVYYSEKELHKKGALESAREILENKGFLYESEGAVFFKSTEFGDEKDRVLIRSNGEPTYFAADIAYHLDKFRRGHDHLIDLWGADHHGYIPRMRASLEAMGYSGTDLEVLLVQFVSLVKGDEKLAMGKRSGNFVTLDELISEIGSDVTRWYFVAKSHDVALDFDLSQALSEDPRENPAKYAQYGHARACSILAKAHELYEKDFTEVDSGILGRLTLDDELEITKSMMMFPQVVWDAANTRSPHKIANFLIEISRMFNSYYTRYKDDPVLPKPTQQSMGWELTWDNEKTLARLAWIECFKVVTGNALNLLGLSSPQYMTSAQEV
ncbi:MAG: arginine--tRNA ligase [Deltaproteobacteria bacterium]|nr:arginine--tRNA ligase [Deltaproteobacteria bacterium]